jgi:hypothetical protein
LEDNNPQKKAKSSIEWNPTTIASVVAMMKEVNELRDEDRDENAFDWSGFTDDVNLKMLLNDLD